MSVTLYRYSWGNTPTRRRWKGRTVRVLARGAMNTVMIEDVATGETMTTSGNALRKVRTENFERAAPE